MWSALTVNRYMSMLVEAIREKISSECGKSMKFCLVLVYVMENIFSYGLNLKIEIGRNGCHLKNGRLWISINKMSKSHSNCNR